MVGKVRGLFFGHYLNVHGPARKIAALDAFIEVTLMTFPAFADERFGFGVGQVFDALRLNLSSI